MSAYISQNQEGCGQMADINYYCEFSYLQGKFLLCKVPEQKYCGSMRRCQNTGEIIQQDSMYNCFVRKKELEKGCECK